MRSVALKHRMSHAQAQSHAEWLKIGFEATLFLIGLLALGGMIMALIMKWVEGFGVLYANPF